MLAILLLAVLSLPALSNNEGAPDADTSTVKDGQFLFPEKRHEAIGELVAQFIQRSHYNEVMVDDDLSSKALDFYIENLDRNRKKVNRILPRSKKSGPKSQKKEKKGTKYPIGPTKSER